MRRQPMTDEQVAEGIRLYQSGLSVARASEALAVSPRTLHRALRSLRIRMRDTHGRERPTS
jgi:predicted HTH domain antitoxin